MSWTCHGCGASIDCPDPVIFSGLVDAHASARKA